MPKIYSSTYMVRMSPQLFKEGHIPLVAEVAVVVVWKPKPKQISTLLLVINIPYGGVQGLVTKDFSTVGSDVHRVG